MMIFVWRLYGEIDLYRIDTPEEIRRTFITLIDTITNWDDKQLNELVLNLEYEELGDVKIFEKVVKMIDPYTSDSFQYGSGIVELD